ncbi:MAG: M1 family metallopeptidase [Myxococcales bacterium]|nr:M1 family metallopeptidase [Myxococcales bacterium]
MCFERSVGPVLLLASLLALFTTVAGCDRGRVPRAQRLPSVDHFAPIAAPRTPRHASYKISAALDPATHVVTATQTLTWKNYGQSPVQTLPFHLYLNGFKNESSLFMRSSRGRHRSSRATENWGTIDVLSIRLNDETEVRALARYVGPDETVLEVPLPTPLGAGETIEIKMRFVAKLPEIFARTGYRGDFHMVAQWFPKIGVRVGVPGAETWACEPFHVSAEFFADFGTYEVDLTVPDAYVVAATGVLVAAERDSKRGVRTLRYRAEDVHDFAWMADPYMVKISGTAKLAASTVEVRVWYRPEQHRFAKRHLAAAIGTVETMSELFLPYPWPVLTIIDPPMDAVDGAGGMEYPTLVTTAGDSVYSRPGIRIPEMVTVHEVGHQWFQGMLASNEAAEAWLDEGVNQWSNGVVMERLYGQPGSVMDWMDLQAGLYEVTRASLDYPSSIPSPIATAAHAFVDNEAYGTASYQQTMLALRTLEGVVGKAKLLSAMKHYAQTWAFRHPTGRDFFAAISEHVGQDLSGFFHSVFHQLGGPELSVRSMSCRAAHEPRGIFGDGASRKVVTESSAPATGAYQCSVIVQNTGPLQLAVDIEVGFEDGTRERWNETQIGAWKELTFARSSPIAEVVIDPDDKVMMADPLPLRRRSLGDPRASYRSGARLGFWAQELMRVVGP